MLDRLEAQEATRRAGPGARRLPLRHRELLRRQAPGHPQLVHRGRRSFAAGCISRRTGFAAPDVMADAGGRRVLRGARLSRRHADAARDRHPQEGSAPLFGGIQEGRQLAQRPSSCRKALGPVRARQAPGVRAQSAPCPRARRDGAQRDAAAHALQADPGNALRLLPVPRSRRHGADAALAGLSRPGRDRRFPAAHDPGLRMCSW